MENQDLSESKDSEKAVRKPRKRLLALVAVTALGVLTVIGLKGKSMSFSYKILKSKAQPVKTEGGKDAKYIAIPTQGGYPVHVYFIDEGVYIIGPNKTELLDKDADGNIELVQNQWMGIHVVDQDDDGSADVMMDASGEMVPVNSEINAQFEEVKRHTQGDVISAALFGTF